MRYTPLPSPASRIFSSFLNDVPRHPSHVPCRSAARLSGLPSTQRLGNASPLAHCCPLAVTLDSPTWQPPPTRPLLPTGTAPTCRSSTCPLALPPTCLWCRVGQPSATASPLDAVATTTTTTCCSSKSEIADTVSIFLLRKGKPKAESSGHWAAGNGHKGQWWTAGI